MATMFAIAWGVLLNVFTLSNAWFNYGHITPYQPGNLQAINAPPGCDVVHLDMVIRHGSRYPCSVNTKPMFQLVQDVNKVHESKPYTYKNLTLPWKFPEEYQNAGNCEQGEAGNEEIFLLAKRFRYKYPTLFNKKKYWNALYRFEASDTPRTSKSAVAFSMGLFDGNGTLDQSKYQPIAIKVSGPKNNDKKLRYYDACARYVKEVVEGAGLDEWKKFNKGPEMKKVISNVEKRLKLNGKVTLNGYTVQQMFRLCAFATMNEQKRDWCSVFDKDDMDILAYWYDVLAYYSASYGNGVSYKTNCPLASDIIDSLKNIVNKTLGRPYGTFRFTHINTMLALQSLFGMYNTTVPLRADNFVQNSNHTFRVSSMVPMTANLAFVLYRCGKEYKVQVLMNEKPALLPCCNQGNSASACSLTKFMSCYEHIAKNCNFDAMCKVSPTTTSGTRLLPRGWVNAMPLFLWLVAVTQVACTYTYI